MGNEYKVVGKFLTKSYATGETDEWKWVYGRQHRDRWKKNDSAA